MMKNMNIKDANALLEDKKGRLYVVRGEGDVVSIVDIGRDEYEEIPYKELEKRKDNLKPVGNIPQSSD